MKKQFKSLLALLLILTTMLALFACATVPAEGKWENATYRSDKTFGKGSMQTTYTIKGGLLGAVKLTTHHYFSGGDKELVGYNGVGILPDVEIALSKEALEYNFYVLPEDLDDQLQAAIKTLNENN